MEPYRIVLADDHIMLRQGIRRLIEASPDMVVVGEVNDGLELLHLLKSVTTDMVVLDISMPKMRGIEATYEIKAAYPDIKVLILTMHKKPEYLRHTLSAGAHGYLLKEDTDEELYTAIKTIQHGRIYVSTILSAEVSHDWLAMQPGQATPLRPILTIREREILQLIAEGNSSKEIADLLYISVRTVETHRASLMRKLSLKNIADLVRYAISKGYTSATL